MHSHHDRSLSFINRGNSQKVAGAFVASGRADNCSGIRAHSLQHGRLSFNRDQDLARGVELIGYAVESISQRHQLARNGIGSFLVDAAGGIEKEDEEVEYGVPGG